MARAESKPAQLRRFARLGLGIPPTLITNDRKDAEEFAAERGPVVCKTFRGLPADADDGCTGAIWTQRVDPKTFDDTLTVTAHLFQAEIPKTGHVRVTVVGRRVFAQQVAAPDGALDDPAWRAAVEAVPRHRFVPGFYLPGEERDGQGLTVWQPVTAALDHGRWLAAAYSDTTLITQFDGDEPDWEHPAEQFGGAPTSSSTLPSLVVRMWVDADVREGQRVLEIGTGTGYSTALACERLGSTGVTSVEVDPHRLERAASALHGCGHTPTLAVADGGYGYWPEAPFDRIVAACSFRAVPPALVAQTRQGGRDLRPSPCASTTADSACGTRTCPVFRCRRPEGRPGRSRTASGRTGHSPSQRARG